MMKKLLTIIMLVCAWNTVGAQRFFNLTADEVRIDSLLPRFSYSMPLGEHYADSTYSVSLRYPEFLDMTAGEAARYDSISGMPLKEMPDIETHVSINRRKGYLDVSFVPLVMRNGKKQILVSFMLNVESAPLKRSERRSIRRAESTRSERYAAHSVLAEGKWAKIRVPASGVYQLTDALVSQAGFSDISKVKIYGYGGNLQNEKFDADGLIATDDLKEVPTYKAGNRRLFYAKGPVSWKSPTDSTRVRNPYSDYGYYLITQSDTEPLTVDSLAFAGSFYPANDDYHSLREVDNYAWYHGGRNLYESDPITVGKTKKCELTVPSGISRGTLYVSMSAENNTTVSIALNDSTLGTMTLTTRSSLDRAALKAMAFKVDNMKETNTVSITTTQGGTARVDYITATFATPRPMPRLTTAQLPTPEYVHNITNQDLHAHGQADMVIIIPTTQVLRSQAERLAEYHRANDNMRVNIVPADELYNEFSSGTPDANAYRRYMKMLYDRAESEADMPKYLLLYGDCAWDNRMLSSDWRLTSPDDFLLAYESENSISEFSCYVNDSWFALLDDGEGISPTVNDKVDVGVGRFPVRTEEEARTMTDKTIAYMENKNSGDWQNTIMFMGDDDPKLSNVNTHMKDINDVAEEVRKAHPAYMIKKVMWDAYTRETSSTGNRYPDIENIVKQQQANGALIMNYAGHGSESSMSHERVLVLDDFQNFQNANLPLWVINACDIMPFDASMATIGEEAVLNKKGGAVAVYSTSRTVYQDRNKKMNSVFMRYALSLDSDGKPLRLGDAVRLSKNNINGRDVNDIHYHLLGDPAMALHLPTYDVVVDSINGVKIKDLRPADYPQLQAGTIAKISGHIEYGGETVSDFNGQMTATVRDTEETIVCKMNHPQQTTNPFTFKDRPKMLFNGSDDVKNGRFSFSLAVPLDINYANETGQLTIHATTDDHRLTAHGETNSFIVGGTGTMTNDSIGPSIYCYLNSPSFTDGGDVNCTPYFVAQITDKDGINASGTGIGHDMELIIDGEMARTYSLNDNFRFDYGSYTTGSTHYYIPELEPGRHQLKFRAWDVQNNSSTATLSFNVVKGLTPSLYSVDCTNNPATTSTTFIISHDRMGSQIDVELEIFDTSGRLLWKHSEGGVTANAAYTIDWDLTVDGGQKLQTGVYLYRVLVSSDGGKQVSKAKKLIVINNK